MAALEANSWFEAGMFVCRSGWAITHIFHIRILWIKKRGNLCSLSEAWEDRKLFKVILYNYHITTIG